jgi:hypothetical protein
MIMDSSGRVSIKQELPIRGSVQRAVHKGFTSNAKIPEGCNVHLVLRALDVAFSTGELPTLGLTRAEQRATTEIWSEYLDWKKVE